MGKKGKRRPGTKRESNAIQAREDENQKIIAMELERRKEIALRPIRATSITNGKAKKLAKHGCETNNKETALAVVGVMGTGAGALSLLVGIGIMIEIGEFLGLFTLLTSTVLMFGIGLLTIFRRLNKRRTQDMLQEPLMQKELELAEAIEVHNRRLRLFKSGNFAEESDTILQMLASEKDNIERQIELLKQAKSVKKTLDKLNTSNTTLPMNGALDILLTTGALEHPERLESLDDELTKLLNE